MPWRGRDADSRPAIAMRRGCTALHVVQTGPPIVQYAAHCLHTNIATPCGRLHEIGHSGRLEWCTLHACMRHVACCMCCLLLVAWSHCMLRPCTLHVVFPQEIDRAETEVFDNLLANLDKTMKTHARPPILLTASLQPVPPSL